MILFISSLVNLIKRYSFGIFCGSLINSYAYAADIPLAIPSGVLINSGLDPSFVAHFALFTAVLLLWTIAAGRVCKYLFRLPVVAGQIIGGIILGPSLIDVRNFTIFSKPLTVFDPATGLAYALTSADIYIFIILLVSAALTVSFLLWTAGHETDIKDLLKVGGTAVSAGLLGAAVPILFTVLVTYCPMPAIFSFAQSIGLGLVFSATSVSIPIAMLFARKKMHLRTSKATLGAAIIDDIAAVVALSLFFIALQGGVFGTTMAVIAHGKSLHESLFYMFISFVVMGFVGYYVIPPIVHFFGSHRLGYLLAPMATGIMLLYFAFADMVGGLAGITGAYFAGFFHRSGDSRHEAAHVITPFVNALLLPLFLGSIGLQVDLSLLSLKQWAIVLVLLLAAILSKLVGCYAAIFLSNSFLAKNSSSSWTMLEGFIFGASMIARGEVGLVVVTILKGSRLITPEQYIMAIVVIVLTTIAAPIMLSIGFALQDRLEGKTHSGGEYSLNIGFFETVGTEQMFTIILEHIKTAKGYHIMVDTIEGQQIVNLEGQDVKIILNLDEGIIFRGKRATIEHIVSDIKNALQDEIDSIEIGQDE